jgi:hypothetical protein
LTPANLHGSAVASVFGERANASAAATAGFQQAMANLGNAGLMYCQFHNNV